MRPSKRHSAILSSPPWLFRGILALVCLLTVALGACGRGGNRAVVAPPATLNVFTVALPDGAQGIAYVGLLQVTGGVGPYTWAITVGILPAGLSLNASTGQITGTPTTAGETQTFTVRATDSRGATATKEFTVTIANPVAVAGMERVSLAFDGSEANGDAGSPAISDDGRLVVFTSFATNLVTGDTNNVPDIFVRDRACNTTVRVNVPNPADQATLGTQATSSDPFVPAFSLAPAISALMGGDYFVAYASDADNLVLDDTNHTRDIYVTAVEVSGCTHTILNTARVSVNSDGEANSAVATLPSLSLDASRVAYHSPATNLIGGDSNDTFDAFVTDLQFSGGEVTPLRTRRVSTQKVPVAVRLDGNLADTLADIFSTNTVGNSTLTMTPDEHIGRLVAIVDGLGAGQTRSITANSVTTLTVGTNWAITPDATTVFRIMTPSRTANIFSATSLGHSALTMTTDEHAGRFVEITGGTGNGQRRLIGTNNATTLTLDAGESDFDPVPDATSIFRVVTFEDITATAGLATSLSLGNPDLAMNDNEHINRPVEIVAGTGAGQTSRIDGSSATTFSIDPDWTVAPDATSVFRVETQSGSGSFRARMSADGNSVAFWTAGSLDSGDTNNLDDVYFHEICSSCTLLTTRESVNTAGELATGGGSRVSAVSGAGNFVLFQSSATNLVMDDMNSVADLFVRDRAGGETTRVSIATGGDEADGPSDAIADISGGGRLVAFATSAGNLDANDRNFARDVYLHDRMSTTTTRLSVAMDNTNPNNESFEPAISLDGSTVVFTSGASNLLPTDTNGVADIFLMPTGLTDGVLLIAPRLPEAHQGAAYDGLFKAAGGAQPLFWSVVEGKLPPSVFLDSRSGALTGIPQRPGIYRFTVEVSDTGRPMRRASRRFEIVVRP